MAISVHVTYADNSRRILKPSGLTVKKDDKGNTLKNILTKLLMDTGDFIVADILINGKQHDRITNNPARLDNLVKTRRITLPDEKKMIFEEKKSLKKAYKKSLKK